LFCSCASLLYSHIVDAKSTEENFDFSELGALAQIFGAVASFLSIILVVIKLCKNLKRKSLRELAVMCSRIRKNQLRADGSKYGGGSSQGKVVI
tara:strand:+ start:226 stop:507 length:282 start_codon:yes stop_codon:yes gene_type:complete